MDKYDILEQKITKAIDALNSLKQENEDLKNRAREFEILKSELNKFREKRDKAKVQMEEIMDTIDKIQLDLKF
ncbi:MAG: hypothetical protein WCI43_05515 [Candidatus Firestonebacteria bacterium]